MTQSTQDIRDYIWGYYGSEEALLRALPACPSKFDHHIYINSGIRDPMLVGDTYIICKGEPGRSCAIARLPERFRLTTITRLHLLLKFYEDAVCATQLNNRISAARSYDRVSYMRDTRSGGDSGNGDVLESVTNLP